MRFIYFGQWTTRFGSPVVVTQLPRYLVTLWNQKKDNHSHQHILIILWVWLVRNKNFASMIYSHFVWYILYLISLPPMLRVPKKLCPTAWFYICEKASFQHYKTYNFLLLLHPNPKHVFYSKYAFNIIGFISIHHLCCISNGG